MFEVLFPEGPQEEGQSSVRALFYSPNESLLPSSGVLFRSLKYECECVIV